MKLTWKKLIIFLFLLSALTAFIIVGLPLVKRKLSKPPVYKSDEPIEYVQIKKADQPDSAEKIEIKQAGNKAILTGAKWIPQTFNNCAPATTSMILQYFGHTVDQNTTKKDLRTNDDDKNVFTYEIQQYLQKKYGIESKLLYNGTPERIKLLIANGFYVMVEDWLHPNEDIGHVTILRGFDDEQGVFIADDSYIGNNIVYKYEEFEQTQWKPFNREYLPIYTPDREAILKQIIGEDWDQTRMYTKAVEKARQEIQSNEKDMYSYFNLGTSYYALEQYDKAKEAFEKSRALGWPRRMLWYQIQPIQTYNKLGEYQKALELIAIGLAGNDSFAELHFESAVAYKGLGNNDKAKSEAQTALNYAPNLQKAQDILSSF